MTTATPTSTRPISSDNLLGYRVEVSDRFDESFERHVPAYYLHGPRGAFYALYRNKKNPDFLYPVNASPSSFGGLVTLKGNSWVRENHESDRLEVVS